MDADLPDLLTEAEVAKLLRCTLRRVRTLCARIPHRRRPILLSRDDVEAYMAARRVEASEPATYDRICSLELAHTERLAHCGAAVFAEALKRKAPAKQRPAGPIIPAYLFEHEAAARLKCHPDVIDELRRSGGLAHYPEQPRRVDRNTVLYQDADVVQLAAVKKAAKRTPRRLPAVPVKTEDERRRDEALQAAWEQIQGDPDLYAYVAARMRQDAEDLERRIERARSAKRRKPKRRF